MFNLINIDLQLFSDFHMYLLFYEGMRDGVYYISKRYSKANNNDVKSYDPK